MVDPGGYLAVLCAALLYGSYFVPAKKYEIHDGLVFQWYQCSGILLAGFACALVRNDWPNDYASSGFYVAPEGLLSGLIFVIANITATSSVKACGLGNYYTVHQVTNLGLTFLIGVYGQNFGVHSTPPKDVGLAALGFIFVLLGMTPVMFMEKDHAAPKPPEQPKPETSEEKPPISPRTPSSPLAPQRLESRPLSELFLPVDSPKPASRPPTTIPENETISRPMSRQPSGGMAGRLADRISRPAKLLIPLPDMRQMNSLTWDGTLGRPQLGDEPLTPPLSCLGDMSMVAKEVEEFEVFGSACEPFLDRAKSDDGGFRQWLGGLALSLLAGVLYSAMYVPQLVWKTRLQLEGYQARGIDFFFSMCVGVYISSTVWLLCGGAYRRYKKQTVEKSVLRPALVSGLLYGCAVLNFLYAMMVLPYAIGYALGCGGGLAVSLVWGTLAFGEGASSHNRRCILCSFAGVFSGIVLLGIAA